MTYQMDLLGRELDGEARGREAGRKEERAFIVRKMAQKGKSIEEISNITDLSEKQIRELIDFARNEDLENRL